MKRTPVERFNSRRAEIAARPQPRIKGSRKRAQYAPRTTTGLATAERVAEVLRKHLTRTDASFIEVNRMVLEDAYSVLIHCETIEPARKNAAT